MHVILRCPVCWFRCEAPREREGARPAHRHPVHQQGRRRWRACTRPPPPRPARAGTVGGRLVSWPSTRNGIWRTRCPRTPRSIRGWPGTSNTRNTVPAASWTERSATRSFAGVYPSLGDQSPVQPARPGARDEPPRSPRSGVDRWWTSLAVLRREVAGVADLVDERRRQTPGTSCLPPVAWGVGHDSGLPITPVTT